MARKNGKTGLVAGLTLAHLLGPLATSGDQILSAANDREQAAIIFREAAGMVRRNRHLTKMATVTPSTKRISVNSLGSYYAAISAEASTKHGYNPSFVAYDEAAQAKNRELYDVLRTSFGAQKEPLLMLLSTQAPNNEHFFSEIVDYGLKVNRGEVDDPTFHLAYYAADEGDDPFNPETWRKANPALGTIRNLKEFEDLAASARNNASELAAFKNLNLNMRYAADDLVFLAYGIWDECSDELPAESDLELMRCFAGLDMSQGGDLTALVLIFEDTREPTVRYWVKPYFWIPKEEVSKKEYKEGVPYQKWVDQGYMRATPGRRINDEYFATDFLDILSRYDVAGVSFDPYRINIFREELSRMGADVEIVTQGGKSNAAIKLFKFAQRWMEFGPAITKTYNLIDEGRLTHGSHPVMTWNIANSRVIMDPVGNRMLDKRKGKSKIDGAVAMVMAIGLMAKYSVTSHRSYLEDNDLVVL